LKLLLNEEVKGDKESLQGFSRKGMESAARLSRSQGSTLPLTSWLGIRGFSSPPRKT